MKLLNPEVLWTLYTSIVASGRKMCFTNLLRFRVWKQRY